MAYESCGDHHTGEPDVREIGDPNVGGFVGENSERHGQRKNGDSDDVEKQSRSKDVPEPDKLSREIGILF